MYFGLALFQRSRTSHRLTRSNDRSRFRTDELCNDANVDRVRRLLFSPKIPERGSANHQSPSPNCAHRFIARQHTSRYELSWSGFAVDRVGSLDDCLFCASAETLPLAMNLISRRTSHGFDHKKYRALAKGNGKQTRIACCYAWNVCERRCESSNRDGLPLSWPGTEGRD